jgi:predicted nucleotidyltransferase
MQLTTAATDYRIMRRQHADAIIAKLRAGLGQVLARFPVEIAYLHGSVAHGYPLPTSDVDLAVLLSEPSPSPAERLTIEFEIQSAVEEACGLMNVDVRAINTAPLLVQGEIVQEGIALYARDRAQRATFEALTRRKYFDYRPTSERMRASFLERIRRKGLARG